MNEVEDKSTDKVSISIAGNVNRSQVLAAKGNIDFAAGQIGDQHSEVSKLFAEIYDEIRAREADPNVEQVEIVTTVNNIEQEVEKGSQASDQKVARWLGFLSEMAPDIYDVVVATLANPLVGISETIRKIAVKAQDELKK